MASSDSNSDDLDAGWETGPGGPPTPREPLRKFPSSASFQNVSQLGNPTDTQVTRIPAPPNPGLGSRPGFRLRHTMQSTPAPMPQHPTPVPETHGEPPASAREAITIRPPMSDEEYVAQMMGQVPDSEVPPMPRASPLPEIPLMPRVPAHFRETLATLLEEEPLRYDREDPRSSAVFAEGPDTVGAAPSIEMDEVLFDDLDPELLRDTPVPPELPIDPMDELDDLPVDEALRSAGFAPPSVRLSPRPSSHPSRAPAFSSAPVARDELRASPVPDAGIRTVVPDAVVHASAEPASPEAATRTSAPPAAFAAATRTSAPPAAIAAATRTSAPPAAIAAATRTSAPPAAIAAATRTSAPPAAIAAASRTSAPPAAASDPFGAGATMRAAREAEVAFFDEVEDSGRPTMSGDDPTSKVGQIKDRFVVGDYSGALVLAEALLDEDSTNSTAGHYAASCREMLRQMYMSRVGEGSFVPRLLMEQDQLRWLTLDHRAGFLLSCIDGASSVDEILDVCGMPSLDALRTMYELLQQGAIVFEPPLTVRR